MKLTIALLAALTALSSCRQVPRPADAALIPSTCPELAYVDTARVDRESDAGKGASKLLSATWDQRLAAAQKDVAAAKKSTAKDRAEKVEAAADALAKLTQDANRDVVAAQDRIRLAMADAAKKLRDKRHVLILPEVPAAGGEDVTSEVVAIMNAGTPEAVAAMRAKDEEISALRKQLAAKDAPKK
jgi:Skp family chaperone for outer membrane proteins